MAHDSGETLLESSLSPSAAPHSHHTELKERDSVGRGAVFARAARGFMCMCRAASFVPTFVRLLAHSPTLATLASSSAHAQGNHSLPVCDITLDYLTSI
jgi:hypothetical protein